MTNEGAGPAGGGVRRFFWFWRVPLEPDRPGQDLKLSKLWFGRLPSEPSCPGQDIKLSWLAGAVLSMKGAHPVDKVPDKTLNCPCRW